MQLSEKFDQILPAMHKARMQFVKVKKDKVNGGAGKSKYATLDSIIDAIYPAMAENNLMFMQDLIESDSPDKMKIETTIMHVSGQWAKFYMEIAIVKHDPQGVGSAFTYGRRYALAACWGLSQADDDAQIAVKSAQDWKRDIERAETMDELVEVFKKAYQASDAASRVIINEAKDKRKAELEVSTARGFTPAAPKQNLAKQEAPEKPAPEQAKPITDFE